MLTIAITESCTGCRACEQKCSKGAIRMIPDSEGFMVAEIDSSICVECGLCRKICPQNTDITRHIHKESLAVRLKDEALLSRSASGGAFAGLATFVLKNKGIVFGVKYDENWNAKFVSINKVEELAALQSSKYVQADTLDTYREISSFLKKGRMVLFAGTSCQIAGLKSFLDCDFSDLITVDLICHGVTSPLLFKKYIAWIEHREREKLLGYNFRDKSIGWGLDYQIKTIKKTKTRNSGIDPYYYHFLAGDMYRECCYSCKYACRERVGDITIGDYWGVEKEHTDFYSDKGVSCLFVNTEKGDSFWKNVQNEFYIQETSFDQVARYNSNLTSPTSRPNCRDNIYDGIGSDDCGNWFDNFADKFRPSLKSRIKSVLPVWSRIILKRMFH